jgi:DNA polymerase-3 subunit epsilon
MGFLDKLTALFLGTTPAAAPAPPPAPVRANEVLFTVSISGPTGPKVSVPDAEVAAAVERYRFVMDRELPALPAADRWWEEKTHKRRLREGSEKALAWLEPFVSVELDKSLALETPKNEFGPLRAEALAKELRALVRERRKLKQPYEDVLRALYGACALAELIELLLFEGYQPHHMAEFVSSTELQALQLDYATMGYQCSEKLGKTDVKWLVEAFGEPAEHQSFAAAWPATWQNAVSRKCWGELASGNAASMSLGQPSQSMQEWLATTVRRNLGYHKEWQERVAAKVARDAEAMAGVEAALVATTQTFVVADLETTGLRAEENDILEFAALRVGADGTVQAEFSMLVDIGRPVPPEIVQLTGISDEDVAREGKRPSVALDAFLAFVGAHPVFFHNAPFDQGFLRVTATALRKKFSNPVHDTLPMSRKAWPALGGYKLSSLAAHVGASAPTHRALSDTKAALAVLLAARAQLKG